MISPHPFPRKKRKISCLAFFNPFGYAPKMIQAIFPSIDPLFGRVIPLPTVHIRCSLPLCCSLHPPPPHIDPFSTPSHLLPISGYAPKGPNDGPLPTSFFRPEVDTLFLSHHTHRLFSAASPATSSSCTSRRSPLAPR